MKCKSFLLISLLTILIFSDNIYAQSQIYFEEDETLFPNPERGWFLSINAYNNNNMEAFPSANVLNNIRNGTNKISIIRRYYIIDDFRTSDISQEFLEEFQNNCDVCRENGFKLIPRFSYAWSYSMNMDDASYNWTKRHIEQLEPYFEANKDVILHLEAGFVGNWGEWHSSSNDHVDNWSLAVKETGDKIINDLIDALPQERMIAFRYYYWNKINYLEVYNDIFGPTSISEAFSGIKKARMGSHHDMVMQNNNWFYHSSHLQKQKDYASEDLKWVVSSGEPTTGGSYTLSTDPRPQLRELKFSNLCMNANGTEHYNYWKDSGYYNDITKYLGYRFRLIKAELETIISPGEYLDIVLDISNDGYAAPYNPRLSELILRNKHTSNELIFDLTEELDLRYLSSGTHKKNITVELPEDLEFGTYELFLNFPDPEPALNINPMFSIRLANTNCWENTTGYNTLTSVEVVSQGTRNRTTHTNLFKVFPNPTSGFLFFSKEVNFELNNIYGKTLLSGYGQSVNLENILPGLYFLRTKFTNQRIIISY